MLQMKIVDCKARTKKEAAAWTLCDEMELIAAVQTYKAMKREQEDFRAAHRAKTCESPTEIVG